MSSQPEYFLQGDQDNRRLQRQHELFKSAMGGSLIVAPIDLMREEVRVLDVGASDGFWLLDFHKDFPAPKALIGTDIDSTRFPKDLPECMTLVQQDMLQPYPIEWKETFDLVHQRLLLVGSRGDPQPFVQRLLELVKPGGWVQLIEGDQEIGERDGPAMQQFMILMTAMVKTFGTPLKFARDMSRWLREAGLEKVGEMQIPLSFGAACPKPELREQSVVSFMLALHGLVEFAESVPELVQISKEELEALPPRCEAELRQRGGYYPMRCVWGQKPIV